MRERKQVETWGTDGVLSIPQPLESTEVEMIDFDGFCFTPFGIRVNMTRADQEQFLRQGYGPILPVKDPRE